jgi:trehalose-6-phosphate synthase
MGGVERRERLGAIRAHVREHDLNRWTDTLLAALDRVATPARG